MMSFVVQQLESLSWNPSSLTDILSCWRNHKEACEAHTWNVHQAVTVVTIVIYQKIYLSCLDPLVFFPPAQLPR